MTLKYRLAKVVRVISLAPLLALATLSLLYAFRSDMYRDRTDLALAIFFLTILPILAYPLQPLIPGFKRQGRDGQRRLAIAMAVLGYSAGVVSALLRRTPDGLLTLYLTYLISGLLIQLFNKKLKIRASGHACGTVGPVVFLVYALGPIALAGAIVPALVFWASLSMGRHTWSELCWGSLLPIVSLGAALALT